MATKEQIDFIWQGKNKAGNKTGGDISASSETIARIDLRKQGVRVLKIKKKSKSLFTARVQPITPAEIAIFSRQLATMLHSGVPLVQSLDIMAKGHKNLSMTKMLLTIKGNIEEGDTLSEALKRQYLHFDNLFCSLVEAGEHAGALETLLDRIATYKEKTESMKKKIKKALVYPVAVICVCFIVTAILLIFVVPVFDELFESFGADLPAFTRFVVFLSEWAQAWWWFIMGLMIACIWTFKSISKRSATFRRWTDRVLLKTPVVGSIIEKSAIARFARTLTTLSAAGVPLVEALESVAGACGNIVFYDAVMQLREDVLTGQRLQFSMEQTTVFPYMVIQMVAIGEEAGALDQMLDKVADSFEEEVDALVDNLSALMEPFIMVILGTLVGGLIVAMYLPIFDMGSALG